MLRLNLAREAEWLDLALGVRMKVEPLTTAIMVAARTDPSVRAIVPGTPDDSIAVIFAKAIASRAIVDWDGVDLHRFCSGQVLMLGDPLFEGHG